jgi:tetratricopeptide (TPR) repeat protein
MRSEAIEAHDGAETFMIRSSVRSAGLAILLTMNGCGDLGSFKFSDTGARTPGLNVAEAALQGGSGEIALQVSEGVLHDSPNNVRALEIKGDALSLLGDYDDAIPIYQSLLAKDPNSVRATIGMGRIKLAKDPAAAAALFEQVLRREPKDLTALNNLGIARDLQGRHADAQTVYRQALAISPDLDSAKVNLALSMAMSGQGAAAVQLLKAKANEPGAPTKIRHDYAVVLAMAGNRPEAERVLSENLSPDEVHQVLDAVTGTHTKLATDQAGAARFASQDQRQWNDAIPPDVVQVPEAPAVPAPGSREARNSATALATPPPMVVHPQPSAESDAAPSTTQPVNPVAAAITNQRPLAMHLRAGDMPPQSTQASVPETTADTVIVTPKVVAMPAARQIQRAPATPVRDASADTAPVAPVMSAAPPVPPSTPAAARLEPPTRTVASEPARVAAPPTRPASSRTVVASLTPPPKAETHIITESDTAALPRVVPDAGGPAVQFAAATSEESAHSFWQSLVHRFPEALRQREPTVIRYEHDGTVFWRVRTEGFDTVSEAQALCARVRAGGQNCFVPRS